MGAQPGLDRLQAGRVARPSPIFVARSRFDDLDLGVLWPQSIAVPRVQPGIRLTSAKWHTLAVGGRDSVRTWRYQRVTKQLRPR